MQVHHCWLGFQAARKHGWLADVWFSDDSAAHLACSQYRSTVSTYDACWVIPEKILVCADPVTTAIDPNPCTFRRVFGDTTYESASPDTTDPDFSMMVVGINDLDPGQSPSNFSSVPKERTASENSFLEGLAARAKAKHAMTMTSPCSISSTATVSKTYQTHTLQPGSDRSNEPLPFSEFLQKHGVSVVVRANLIHETGMQCESYDKRRLQEYGIEHLDLPFEDYDGSLPPDSVCAALLKSMQEYLESDDAICIHCKGGFGRSAVMVCVLAVHHYDVCGEAMLGWVRIARPGAITTPQQERFLCSLRGRGSVDALVKPFTAGQQRKEGAKPSAGCCALQ